MTELAELKSRHVAEVQAAPKPPELSPSKKAAIIIGALGIDAAGPILEQMDETALRNFAAAMSKLHRIGPQVVAETIIEFVTELNQFDQTINGGLENARAILEQYVNEATLARIMDDADLPSVHNVWRKLSKVDDQALTEFLGREHPQTASVVLSKLAPEQAARVLSGLDEDKAKEIVYGLMKTSGLDAAVIEAIGGSVSRDFLAKQSEQAQALKPADRVGAIMNYSGGEVRKSVLDFLEETKPDFAADVKRKMFTFEDIPDRIEKRDLAAVVRAADQDTLLTALAGAAENAPETREYLLSGISSRVAEQIREELDELGKVKIREAEEAQTEILKTIRALEAAGELVMKSDADD
jgi:flagellar motor switch protein FliG